jgi:hypothetical protein
MTGLTATRILRTSLRLALTAFAIGMLLGMTATVASAAPGDAVPATLAAEHAPTDESPPAPTGPGGLTTCPEGQDCDPEPVDPKPQHDASGDLTACPKWQKCDPPPKQPGGLTTCPEDQDCTPSEDPTDPAGGLTTCPEDQDCSPTEDPTEPVGDPDPDPDDGTAGHDIPVPTRIDTGRGGAAPAAWSWSLLGDVLLALAAGSVGAYAGARL